MATLWATHRSLTARRFPGSLRQSEPLRCSLEARRVSSVALTCVGRAGPRVCARISRCISTQGTRFSDKLPYCPCLRFPRTAATTRTVHRTNISFPHITRNLLSAPAPHRWHSWIDENYDAGSIRPINTLSLTLFVVSPDGAEEITAELMRTVFVAAPATENCLLAVPNELADAFAAMALSAHFNAVVPKDESAHDATHRLMACSHASLCPHLYVRAAEPEDFDDLIPIFNSQSEVLKSQYGAHDFFLAELIEAQNEHQKCLVAVVDGHAVGLMSLSSEVELGVLKECFDVGAYDGLENAFAIALFCVDPPYVSRSLDFMAVAFDLFPEQDYCVITMPHAVPEIPLVQNFTKAAPLTTSNLPHEMWLMHRHGLLVDVAVRPFDEADREAVAGLVSTLSGSDLILADIDRIITSGADPDGTAIEAYVTTSCGKVVGVTVFRSAQEDAAQFRAHYNIEEYILYLQHRTFEHAHLNHFVVNPVFERHSKFVLRDAMRLSGKSCIYYRTYNAEDQAAVPMPYTPISMLDSMVPVRHRRQIEYPLDVLKSNVPSSRVRTCDPPAAVTFLNRKLMLEPKIPVNVRIVVVGDTDTSLSFLESLVMKPHLRFANLTLVSPNALEATGAAQPDNAAGEGCLADSCAWTAADKKRVAWGSWVNVIDDKLVEIDREEQMLALESGAMVAYDYLVLAPGLEYNAWNATPTPAPSPPNGVEVINSKDDAAAFLDWAESRLPEVDQPVIVYGKTVDAFTAVRALLAARVSSDMIVLVLPGGAGACFDTPEVAEMALDGVHDAGVDVREGYTLVDWGGEDEVEFARFTDADGVQVRVECAGFLCFHAKSVDPQYFDAVNNCHLVFDGRLVVDNQYRTNDAQIFAAGSFTKFSRKYYAGGKQQALNQNEKETGKVLAEVILGIIDPIAGSPSNLGNRDLPTIEAPRIVSALLPGDLQLLYVGSCEADGPGARRLVSKNEDKQQFFSLTVSEGLKVSEICVVAPVGSYSVSNILCLHGQHEKLLNSVVSRYDEGLIADFFPYFRAPWSMALYHDRFPEYMAEMTDRIGANPSVEIKKLEAAALKLAGLRVSKEEDDFRQDKDGKLLAEAIACVSNDTVASLVKNRLMDFLTYNSYHLPMYARPTSW